MADITTADAPVFEFVDIEDTASSNEYDAVVAALNTAGPDKGFPITTKTDKHKSALRRFGEAAHRIDRSSRRHGETVVKGDESTTIVRLRPRVTKKTADTPDETADVAVE